MKNILVALFAVLFFGNLHAQTSNLLLVENEHSLTAENRHIPALIQNKQTHFQHKDTKGIVWKWDTLQIYDTGFNNLKGFYTQTFDNSGKILSRNFFDNPNPPSLGNFFTNYFYNGNQISEIHIKDSIGNFYNRRLIGYTPSGKINKIATYSYSNGILSDSTFEYRLYNSLDFITIDSIISSYKEVKYYLYNSCGMLEYVNYFENDTLSRQLAYTYNQQNLMTSNVYRMWIMGISFLQDSITYNYDSLNRLSKEEILLPGKVTIFNYHYNTIGLVDSMFIIDSIFLNTVKALKVYQYNSDGKISHIAKYSLETPPVEVANYEDWFYNVYGDPILAENYEFRNSQKWFNEVWTNFLADENVPELLRLNVNGGKFYLHYSPFAVGINHGIKNFDALIYPNPAQNSITIEIPKAEKESFVTIYNLSGQKISQLQFMGEKTNVDLSALKSGIYIVEVRNDKMVVVKKVVKE